MTDLGRPSDYKPEYCQKLIDYFSVEPYTEKKKSIVTKSGDVIECPIEVASDFPSFAGFACLIGTHRETLRNWCTHFPEFFAAYKKGKELQEQWMLINGNKGLINPAFGIFTAKNVLGYKDKVEQEMTGSVQVNHKNMDPLLNAMLTELKDVTPLPNEPKGLLNVTSENKSDNKTE